MQPLRPWLTLQPQLELLKAVLLLPRLLNFILQLPLRRRMPLCLVQLQLLPGRPQLQLWLWLVHRLLRHQLAVLLLHCPQLQLCQLPLPAPSPAA